MKSNKEITILHLYPDLLNLYGDKGNISALAMRLKWRGIDANIKTCVKENEFTVNDADIIFLGGGSDREQEVVCELLQSKKDELVTYVENGGVMLAACGGFQMIGKYYDTASGIVNGVGILDIYSDYNDKRLIGNVVVESELVSQKIIGFENHPHRTNIGTYSPLGRVLSGFGNGCSGDYEGLIYKNLIATNLHGPILPKNPMLCDYILCAALKNKYEDFDGLKPLNDKLENLANESVGNRIMQNK